MPDIWRGRLAGHCPLTFLAPIASPYYIRLIDVALITNHLYLSVLPFAWFSAPFPRNPALYARVNNATNSQWILGICADWALEVIVWPRPRRDL